MSSSPSIFKSIKSYFVKVFKWNAIALCIVMLFAFLISIFETDEQREETRQKKEARQLVIQLEKEAEQREIQIAHDSKTGYRFVEKVVPPKLKSPSTAKLPHYLSNDVICRVKNDSTFIYTSYVDSQNGFGAMIRTKFAITIEKISEDRFKTIDLTFF